jgi:hypothetical protein
MIYYVALLVRGLAHKPGLAVLQRQGSETNSGNAKRQPALGVPQSRSPLQTFPSDNSDNTPEIDSTRLPYCPSRMPHTHGSFKNTRTIQLLTVSQLEQSDSILDSPSCDWEIIYYLFVLFELLLAHTTTTNSLYLKTSLPRALSLHQRAIPPRQLAVSC